uniref:CHCH domain-containing protein n=1 Tax=Oryza meridionalis TaxID=40149 RepID=A0A0E0DJQ4_9ORYZ
MWTLFRQKKKKKIIQSPATLSRERKRKKASMATAKAATAPPTHRASSPAAASPPYPSAARIADSDCFPQYTASLKCLEANQDKSKCQQQFDDYKECKKRENFP